MRPSHEQIERAAYDRWRRRGGQHGDHQADWVAAEDELIFALNYRVVTRVDLDQTPARRPRGERLCRYCESSSATRPRERPRSSLGLPGASQVLDPCECDICRTEFLDDLAVHFQRFAEPFFHVPTTRGLASRPRYIREGEGEGEGPTHHIHQPRHAEDGVLHLLLPGEPCHSIAAFKYLTRLAIALLPRDDLEEYAAAVEWASNPNHAQDVSSLGPLVCRAYLTPRPFATAWVALARLIDPEAPHPAMLLFAGCGSAAFQIAVPLGQRDEDRDGEAIHEPTITLPGAIERAPRERPCLCLVMNADAAIRGATLELPYQAERLAEGRHEHPRLAGYHASRRA